MKRALLLLLCACQARTELMLGVATDLAAPGIIDEVRLEVSRGGTGVPQQAENWRISGTGEPFNLPGSFGLYSDDSALPLDIVLTGLKANVPVVTRTAKLSLVDGETLFYRMGLTAGCRDMTSACPTGTTCVEGRCEAEEIDARKLPDLRPEHVTELTCQSGATYVDTTTGQAMPLSADAASCPFSLCSEGTCLKPPSGARLYSGVCLAQPFSLLIDGNDFTVSIGRLGVSLQGTGMASATDFQATAVVGDGLATIEGTFAGNRADGTITIASPTSTQTLVCSAIAGTSEPYCGSFTRDDGYTDGFWSFVISGEAVLGQYGGDHDTLTTQFIFGSIEGTARAGSLGATWQREQLIYGSTQPQTEAGSVSGTIDSSGNATGTWSGTSDGRAVTGTFTADQASCAARIGGCTNCRVGTECVNGVCVGIGALRITLQWQGATDVDLHVLTPNGNEISFANKMADSGTLDVDDIGEMSLVENVFFTAPPVGRYQLWARNYSGNLAVSFTLLTVATPAGVVAQFAGQLPALAVDSQRFPYDFTGVAAAVRGTHDWTDLKPFHAR